MTKRNRKSTNYSSSQPLSGVLRDWMESIYQLQYWNELLQKAIDEKTNNKFLNDGSNRQLVELMQLKMRIVCGLDGLEKKLGTTQNEDSLSLQALEIIEDTQTVLQWCIDIRQQLDL